MVSLLDWFRPKPKPPYVRIEDCPRLMRALDPDDDPANWATVVDPRMPMETVRRIGEAVRHIYIRQHEMIGCQACGYKPTPGVMPR